MSRLHEPIQDHIHAKLASVVNEAIICIKLHHFDVSDQTPEQQSKIVEARAKHHCPTWEEIAELLRQVRVELDECKIPFKRY
jgi:hypothetical protein